MVPGVIDSDYTGEIKVLISPPTKTVQINKGQRIAQLLLFTLLSDRKTLTSQARGPRRFGSSDLAFRVQEITASSPLAPTEVKSAKILDWHFEDTCGTSQPYVVPSLPFSL